MKSTKQDKRERVSSKADQCFTIRDAYSLISRLERTLNILECDFVRRYDKDELPQDYFGSSLSYTLSKIDIEKLDIVQTRKELQDAQHEVEQQRRKTLVEELFNKNHITAEDCRLVFPDTDISLDEDYEDY